MSKAQPNAIFEVRADDELEAHLDAAAEAVYRAGRFVPHERVREWLARLAEGEDVPPPSA